MQAHRPTHIYVVENSASIRARLAELLAAMEGIRLVGEAATYEEALAGISSTHPDSVLLDLNLAGRSGIELLRLLSPAHPGIVFVVLSNCSEPQYRRACERAGARYFLDKSTEFHRVREVVSRIAANVH